MLSAREKEYVRNTVIELVKLRKQFTGEDVYMRLNSKYVRGRPEKYTCQASASDVSTFVRGLFNRGDSVFMGSNYGSAPSHVVAPAGGPLLYFPLPYHAKKKLVKIVGHIANTSTTA